MNAVLSSNRASKLRFRIRALLAGFMVGLVVSGATAFPLPQELLLLTHWLGIPASASPDTYEGLKSWLVEVRNALIVTDARYPYLPYGTDWLAFGHIVIALMFIGPLKDPVRNVWVIQWAMISCVLVWPLALICGPIRGIPFGWQLIDCSFGAVGLVPLIVCLRDIKELERMERPESV